MRRQGFTQGRQATRRRVMGVPIGKRLATGFHNGRRRDKVRCPGRQVHNIAPRRRELSRPRKHFNYAEWLDISDAVRKAEFPCVRCHGSP